MFMNNKYIWNIKRLVFLITTCTSETHSNSDSNNGCSWSCCSIKSKDTELDYKDGVSGTVMPNLQINSTAFVPV